MTIFDPLGNAMHTVMAQPVAGKTLAIVGADSISEAIVFKGTTVRASTDAWYQCERFLLEHKLDLSPLIAHQMPSACSSGARR
jgi:hypothetical protein